MIASVFFFGGLSQVSYTVRTRQDESGLGCSKEQELVSSEAIRQENIELISNTEHRTYIELLSNLQHSS